MSGPLTKSALTGYVAAILLVGSVAGGLAGYRAGTRKAMLLPHNNAVQNRMADYLKSRLHVTDRQLERMQPVLAETACEFENICTNTADRVNQLFERANQRISPFLDEDQKKLLADMERQRQQQFQNFLKPEAAKSGIKP